MPRITKHGGPSIYGVTPVKGARTAVESVRVSTVDLIGEASAGRPDTEAVTPGEGPDGAVEQLVDDTAADSADEVTEASETGADTKREPAATVKPRKATKAAARRSTGGR